MQNPNLFYKAQLAFHQQASKGLYTKMQWLSVLRLVVFGATVIGIYFTFQNWQIALSIAVFGAVLFLFLLSKYTDIKAKRALHKRTTIINEEELKIASGGFYDRPNGTQFQDSKHPYSLDIDVFGKGSFFQFINRTTITEGTDKLAALLLKNDITNIEERQNAIKELSENPEWIQYYTAVAQGVDTEHSAQSIISWLKDYQPFLSSLIYKLSIVYSLISVLIIALGVAKIISIDYIGYLLFLGLAITSFYLKKINNVAQHTSKAKDTFKQYALLLKAIEEKTFQSQLLIKQQQKIKAEDLKASEIFTKYSKALDALDNRNNFISAIFGNGYLLWDIRQTYRVEKWITTYADKVEDWFEVVTFFDAYNSFGNYGFNHQDFVYPQITNTSATIKALGLAHPLLNSKKRVASNLEITNQNFFIVTGANMAGKSTFLRTIALHIVMANVGLPVCAKSSKYTPIKLITSMRTTDSLTEESSYFFSELTRLKFIVDTVTTETNYFIILDEILKGTNSKDKAIGSRKFVEKLVELSATGIIATHDLSLTEIETELEPVKNYYFDAEIIDDELYFDYKLKQGVCLNMNASFLLKKMNII